MNHPTLRLVALASVTVLLAACASSDNASGPEQNGEPALLSSLSTAVANIGNTVGNSEELGMVVGPEAAAQLGNTIASTGGTVSNVATAVDSGLATLGGSGDPVGATTTLAGSVGQDAPVVVSNVANTVDALGAESSPLAPLAPVTGAVADGLNTVNESAVVAVGDGLTGALQSEELGMVTQALSDGLNPVTDGLGQVTTTVGGTGIGAPLSDALNTVDSQVTDALGAAITDSGVPIISELGAVVDGAGTTVASTGTLVDSGSDTGTGANPLGQVLDAASGGTGQLPIDASIIDQITSPLMDATSALPTGGLPTGGLPTGGLPTGGLGGITSTLGGLGLPR